MRRPVVILSILALATLLLCAARLLVGGTAGWGWGSWGGWPEDRIIWQLRANRLACGATVGAALAVAGALLQTLLRNPLASPDILGVSSGASLGVMTSIWLTAGGVVGTLASAAWHAGPALLGAVGALALVLTLSRRAGSLDPAGLVIIGVVVSVLCGAAVMFLQYLMPDAGFATARLLMGGLSDDTPSIVLVLVAVATLAGIVIAWLKGPTLDALVLGPDEAESVGVHVARARWVLLGITGTLSAGAVVIAGPIGFVGLIAPHAARLLLRVPHSNHRWQLPASAMLGVIVIVGADCIIKGVNLGAGRLPLGVLTALIGGPALILLLRRRGWVET
ncbi:MAG: iron ABC transporter permease [Phycisphaeraceae bacterium]|nr:iron ABC transporter permease [Phycisphaeraceae bacterium]